MRSRETIKFLFKNVFLNIWRSYAELSITIFRNNFKRYSFILFLKYDFTSLFTNGCYRGFPHHSLQLSKRSKSCFLSLKGISILDSVRSRTLPISSLIFWVKNRPENAIVKMLEQNWAISSPK